MSKILAVAKTIINPKEKASAEFWISHIIIIVSTVLGVYLAAGAGFDVAVEFEKTRMDRELYYMESALLSEIRDNTEYASSYSTGYLKGEINFKQGANNELDTFIWTTMTNTGHSFQIEAELLTQVRRFYSNVSKNLRLLSEGRNAFAAKEIKRLSEEASLKLIPEMEKNILKKYASLKERNIID
ncbi:MAG: hypothetical protein DIZ80_04960 [endosymbiont of Galathealinum brachiosum]|uniref:Uncharacterized protein n=1 Tax=endosymbiont of Galathealinum brachiosum TaxID=2200906 RepID=A0A370DKH5_9GAMM|nr:MAG: hypothetical protein DIZ80_04960 [endosymbiont of Galathealinum brachiosum]